MPVSKKEVFLGVGITLPFLRECFIYRGGKLYWKERPAHHFKSKGMWSRHNKYLAHKEAGYVLGGKTTYNYVVVKLKEQQIAAHRIIWYMFNGYIPDVIDHINHDCADNRICNLRDGTYYANALNTDRFNGCVYNKKHKTWRAVITHGGKRTYLGSYRSKELALVAYKAAAKVLKSPDDYELLVRRLEPRKSY